MRIGRDSEGALDIIYLLEFGKSAIKLTLVV